MFKKVSQFTTFPLMVLTILMNTGCGRLWDSVSRTSPSVNLLANTGFEEVLNSTTDWYNAPCFGAVSSAQFFDGASSFLVDDTWPGGWCGIGQSVPVEPNKKYSLSFELWIDPAATVNEIYVQINAYDASSTALGRFSGPVQAWGNDDVTGRNIIYKTDYPSGQWKTYTLTFTETPPNTATLTLVIAKDLYQDSSTGIFGYIDDVRLVNIP